MPHSLDKSLPWCLLHDWNNVLISSATRKVYLLAPFIQFGGGPSYHCQHGRVQRHFCSFKYAVAASHAYGEIRCTIHWVRKACIDTKRKWKITLIIILWFKQQWQIRYFPWEWRQPSTRRQLYILATYWNKPRNWKQKGCVNEASMLLKLWLLYDEHLHFLYQISLSEVTAVYVNLSF